GGGGGGGGGGVGGGSGGLWGGKGGARAGGGISICWGKAFWERRSSRGHVGGGGWVKEGPLTPPFLEKSMARWLEMPWLPPLPMNISLLPRSCDLCARLRTISKPRSRPMSWPDRSVTALSRMAPARVSKYATILSRMGTSYLQQLTSAAR